MNIRSSLLLGGLALILMLPATAADYTYPKSSWPSANPGVWSVEALRMIEARATELGTGGPMVVHEGRVVMTTGNLSSRRLVQSQRKALLGAAFGVAVDKDLIDLSATLADLQIDDDPSLTDGEKRATVEDLLRSRSGVFHSSIYEHPSWKKRKPERGSREPGEVYFYNNWDFNVLGTIFERQTKMKMGDAFDEWIAKPTGMQDFRPRDVSYLTRRSMTERILDNESDHAAYIFHMSTRDMARLGLLYLSDGEWDGKRVVSREWVRKSWDAKPTEIFPDSYGLLWFIITSEPFLSQGGLTQPIYLATGAGGHKLVVIPELDLVVAHSVAARGAGLMAQLKRRFFGRHAVDDREFYGLLLEIVKSHPRIAN